MAVDLLKLPATSDSHRNRMFDSWKRLGEALEPYRKPQNTYTYSLWAYIRPMWLYGCMAFLTLSFSASRWWTFALTSAIVRDVPLNLMSAAICMAIFYGVYRHLQNQVYLIDFAIYEGLDLFNVTRETFMQHTRKIPSFTQESLDFQEKIIARSGLGNSTSFPLSLRETPPSISIKASRDEFVLTALNTVERLFAATGLRPDDIDIVVVNCSLFNPTPSLSEMVINYFKMRSNIINYNLSGMGCSAGIIALDLARDLLKVHKNSRCLVISTENIAQNWYLGNDKVRLMIYMRDEISFESGSVYIDGSWALFFF
jgi:hypothetical protein